MLTHHEINAMRSLWQSVAIAAMDEHRKRIDAARRGTGIRNHHNKTDRVYSTDTEINIARSYFGGADFREVCGMAGIGYKLDRIMAYVLGGPEGVQRVKDAAGIGKDSAWRKVA